MAASSLLALLDDIATLLDDISAMTKVAAKQTAAVMGDDLAVNAEKVLGVRASRELPVVWAVAKGSLLNKVILVPAALLVAALAPWMITPMLVCGGLFLCFEGAEKVLHQAAPADNASAATRLMDRDTTVGTVGELERRKIRGAIRTDFILSLEIIVLTLAVVETSGWMVQLGVLALVSLLMVIGVYGLVAGIVKIDDLGAYLIRTAKGSIQRRVGQALLDFAPRLMKLLSIVGTAAMFMVGGGILLHASPHMAHFLVGMLTRYAVPEVIANPLMGTALGVAAGMILALAAMTLSRLKSRL